MSDPATDPTEILRPKNWPKIFSNSWYSFRTEPSFMGCVNLISWTFSIKELAVQPLQLELKTLKRPIFRAKIFLGVLISLNFFFYKKKSTIKINLKSLTNTSNHIKILLKHHSEVF